MTYNLRYAASAPPELLWDARRPRAVALIRAHTPDVIGTQEGLFPQVQGLEDDLPEYAWVGLGRDGGSRGEFMAVFYRRDRLRVAGYDHFWLSDTPDTVGSSTWGNHNRRMVTRVRFADRADGDRPFTLVNTHFDFDPDWHERGATLLLARTADLSADEPAIVTGDFNAGASRSRCHEVLVGSGGWRDAWDESAERGPAIGTFHGYGPAVPDGDRIDWILLKGPVHAHATRIVTDGADDGAFPSDHFPVVSDLALL